MYRIHPIDQTTCAPFRGLPCIAIMKDGSRQIGILGRLENGVLILNDDGAPLDIETGSIKGRTAKIRTRKRRKTRNTTRKNAVYTAGLTPEPIQEFQEEPSPRTNFQLSPFGPRADLPVDFIDSLFLLTS